MKAAIVRNYQESIQTVTSYLNIIENRFCRKAGQKLHALSRIAKYISEDKKRMLLKPFIISQFNYCPIVWMCHGRGLNNEINNIHKRALRIVYQDKKSIFETLLKREKSSQFMWKTSNIWLLSYLKQRMTFLQKSWKTFLFFKKMKL